tara:strand:- start:47 stop:247 length:201 start_codon:yes stop_codon:yes gene_type:complete
VQYIIKVLLKVCLLAYLIFVLLFLCFPAEIDSLIPGVGYPLVVEPLDALLSLLDSLQEYGTHILPF